MSDRYSFLAKVLIMYIHMNPTALIALIAGILILVRPTLLNYIVAIYLIVTGVLGLGLWR